MSVTVGPGERDERQEAAHVAHPVAVQRLADAARHRDRATGGRVLPAADLALGRRHHRPLRHRLAGRRIRALAAKSMVIFHKYLPPVRCCGIHILY